MKTELQAASYKLQGVKMVAFLRRRAELRAESVGGAAPALFDWLKGLRALQLGACSLELGTSGLTLAACSLGLESFSVF